MTHHSSCSGTYQSHAAGLKCTHIPPWRSLNGRLSTLGVDFARHQNSIVPRDAKHLHRSHKPTDSARRPARLDQRRGNRLILEGRRKPFTARIQMMLQNLIPCPPAYHSDQISILTLATPDHRLPPRGEFWSRLTIPCSKGRQRCSCRASHIPPQITPDLRELATVPSG